MMNLQEYAEYENQIADELGRSKSSQYLDPTLLGEGTDWQDEIFRSAWMQNHQLSVASGTDKTQIAGSGGYFSQDGIIIGSDFDRLTGRLSFDSQLKIRRKWLDHPLITLSLWH